MEWKGWKKVKYQAEVDPNFGREIASLPGGEKLFSCIQCGNCSALCPLSSYMEYSPRRIIGMVRAGFKGEVLTSYTTWLCASCYACTVECPREIKITDIMYSIKQKAIQEKVYKKRFPIPILAEEFFAQVLQYGRTTEGLLISIAVMKSNPFAMFKSLGLGIKMLRTGRMGFAPEKIKQQSGTKGNLRTILAAVNHLDAKSKRLIEEGVK